MTREVLIRTARDQDGGAHADHSVDGEYLDVGSGAALRWFTEHGGVEMPIGGLHRATIRQIATRFCGRSFPDT